MRVLDWLIIPVIVVVVCILSACFSQPKETKAKCTVDKSRLGGISGYRLGMSRREARGVDPNRNGYESRDYQPAGDGLDSYTYILQYRDEVKLDFVDDYIASISREWVDTDAINWKRGELPAKVAEQLGLNFRDGVLDSDSDWSIECNGFTVRVYKSTSPKGLDISNITLRDTAAMERAESRRRERYQREEEEKKSKFKF